MKLSIRKIAGLTGKSRDSVASILEAAGLPFTQGEKRAREFESSSAFEAIYGAHRKGSSLEEAKRDQAATAACLNRVRAEVLQKDRIPISIVVELWDAALQAFAATLKAAKGQVLTVDKINELLGHIRAVKLPTNW